MTPRTPVPDAEATATARPHARTELERHGLRPKKSLGQNFLGDASACRRIAELACSDGAGSVLEIGAGLGALTAPLLDRGCQVTSVETDSSLVQVLRATFAEQLAAGRFQLLHADAKELDFRATLEQLPRPRSLAGNLPYHLSGLLLRRAIDASMAVDRAVFLLQLEVVGRLCAAPGTADYGALSVFAQAVYTPRRAFVVKRGAFYPAPNVDSAVVVLEPRADRGLALDAGFAGLVRAAFEKRRKTLRNAWRGIFGTSNETVEAAASAAAIELNCRGEVLAVEDFARMARALAAAGVKATTEADA